MALVLRNQIQLSKHSRNAAFALPTILITSIVMLIVLLVSVSSTTAVRNSMKNQYYAQLAQVAGEAGVAYAQACLNSNPTNPGAPLWSDAHPLMANTDCSGIPLAGFSCPSADTRCSVTLNGNIRSNFRIGMPPLDADGHATTLPNTGFVDILRTSNSAVWRTYSQNSAPTTVVPDLCSGSATGAFGWGNSVIYAQAPRAGFPEPSANSISISSAYVSPGPMYLRKDFSVTTDGMYTLNVQGDDKAEVTIDGLSIATSVNSLVTTTSHLGVGCHTMMVKLTNNGLLVNPATLILSLELTGASAPLVISDKTWRVSAGNLVHYSQVNYYADPVWWTPVRDINSATGQMGAAWTNTSSDTMARWISTTHSYDGSGNYPANQFTLMRDNRVVNVAANTTVKVTLSCDDACYPYLDGTLFNTGVTGGPLSFTVSLAAGTHKFALMLFNGAGPSAFAFAAVNTSDGTVLTDSDDSWSAASFWSATNPTNSYSYDNTYTPNPDPRPIAQCPCNQYQAAVLASGPFAYWPLNETSGTVATDISGSGLNGTYYGLVTQNQLGPLAAASNHAVLFGGSGNVAKVSMATSAVWNRTNGQAFSVETWIKPNWSSGYRDIVVNRGTAGTYNWILYQHTTDGSLQLHGTAQNKSSYIPSNGVWTYVVDTVDTGGTSRLYANGVLVQTVPGYIYGASPGSVVHIGNGPSDVVEPFGGLVDDVALYTKALSQAEISAHYAARLLP